MPFDSIGTLLVQQPLSVHNPHMYADWETRVALYKERRESALGMWLSVPPQSFRMDDWDTCALGWLANRQHDGWHWAKRFKKSPDNDREPSRDGDKEKMAPLTRGKPFSRAGWYF